MEEEEEVALDILDGGDFSMLVDALERKDERAWTDAYDRLHQVVLAAILRRYGGDSCGSCADAVQSAFRTFIRRVAGGQAYDFNHWKDLAGYLIVVAASKRCRPKNKEVALTDGQAASIAAPDMLSNVETEEEAEEQANAAAEIQRSLNSLRSACNECDVRYWRMVRGRLVGKTKNELAKEFDCSEKTVQRAWDFAKQYMRDRLDESELKDLRLT